MNKYVLKQETIVTPKTAGMPPFTMKAGTVYKLEAKLDDYDILNFFLTTGGMSYRITRMQRNDLLDRSVEHIEEND